MAKGHWPRQRSAKSLILEMLKNGDSVDEISQELGVTKGQVRVVRNLMKIKKASDE